MKVSFAGTGCVCVLTHVEHGAPLVTAGNVPPALIGAKWADVLTWSCLVWRDGKAHAAKIKCDMSKLPPELDSLLDHMSRHPQVWQPVDCSKVT